MSYNACDPDAKVATGAHNSWRSPFTHSLLTHKIIERARMGERDSRSPA